MQCRSHCNACCIAPSINHPIPNMPQGKAAGEVCANLDPDAGNCTIWGHEAYPDTCRQFQASIENCGDSRDEALIFLTRLELETQPD